MPRLLFRLLALATAAAALATSTVPAADGPAYFRSDLGLGRAVRALPDDLDDRAAFRWRTPIDPGHSTPIPAGDRWLLTTFRPESRELAVVAIEAATGRLLWRHGLAPGRLEETHTIGSPATATPATDGERVYAFFGSHGLVCLDLDGRPLWEQRMGPFQDEYGAGSSPILVGDRLILNQDHDTDSFLGAWDRRTGRPLWKTARPDAVRSYSTPAVWMRNGSPELLVAGALELAGYDPEDGRRRWRVGGLARIVIPTPIPAGDTVYMASWAPGGDAGRRLALPAWPDAVARWDRDRSDTLARAEIDDAEVLDRFFRIDLDQSGDLSAPEWNRHAEVFLRARNGLMAVRPSGSGDLGESAVLWQSTRGAPYVSTPVLTRGRVWMVKDGGIVTRIDAARGERLDDQRLAAQGGYYASPVAGDGKVYFASQAGWVTVVADQSDWRVISSRNFGESIFATPVLAGNRIVIRTGRALYSFAVGRD